MTQCRSFKDNFGLVQRYLQQSPDWPSSCNTTSSLFDQAWLLSSTLDGLCWSRPFVAGLLLALPAPSVRFARAGRVATPRERDQIPWPSPCVRACDVRQAINCVMQANNTAIPTPYLLPNSKFALNYLGRGTDGRSPSGHILPEPVPPWSTGRRCVAASRRDYDGDTPAPRNRWERYKQWSTLRTPPTLPRHSCRVRPSCVLHEQTIRCCYLLALARVPRKAGVGVTLHLHTPRGWATVLPTRQ